jgi:hypothetical protein
MKTCLEKDGIANLYDFRKPDPNTTVKVVRTYNGVESVLDDKSKFQPVFGIRLRQLSHDHTSIQTRTSVWSLLMTASFNLLRAPNKANLDISKVGCYHHPSSILTVMTFVAGRKSLPTASRDALC